MPIRRPRSKQRFTGWPWLGTSPSRSSTPTNSLGSRRVRHCLAKLAYPLVLRRGETTISGCNTSHVCFCLPTHINWANQLNTKVPAMQRSTHQSHAVVRGVRFLANISLSQRGFIILDTAQFVRNPVRLHCHWSNSYKLNHRSLDQVEHGVVSPCEVLDRVRTFSSEKDSIDQSPCCSFRGMR